jgi:Uncharacterized protein encoded in toxicity protection region of plasmid R478, contains von Willebrand factor (vWF) domain
MDGTPMKNLNKAINDFRGKLSLDEMAKKRVDVAVIQFNDSPELVQNFTPILMMKPVTLEAGGQTAMGAAINFAIDKVKERNRFYASMGIPCFKPWIFMITDGAPTDDVMAAANRIKEEESKGKFGKLKFFALGTPGANMDTLSKISKRVLKLEDTDFSGIFDWLAESMSIISVSQVGGAEAQLPKQLPKNASTVPSTW